MVLNIGHQFEIEFNFPDICFMRLDFDTFLLNGPTDTADEATGGLCGRDSFTMTVSKLVFCDCHNKAKQISIKGHRDSLLIFLLT